MTVLEARLWAEELFAQNNVEYTDIEWLMCFVLNIKRSHLGLNKNKELTPKQQELFLELALRRAKGEPLQYIIGSQDFFNITLKTDSRALIPRFDSEAIVENIIKKINKTAERNKLHILDIGCGTGALGLSIAYGCENITGVLCDISKDALSLAYENTKSLKLENRIKIVHSDLFENIKEKFDIIISNPPYIKSAQIEGLDREIKDFEPHLALDGGSDGLLFYKKIISAAPEFLNPNGILVFEAEGEQFDFISDFAKATSGFTTKEIIYDLSENKRGIILARD